MLADCTVRMILHNGYAETVLQRQILRFPESKDAPKGASLEFNVFLCVITSGLWLLVLLVKFLMSNSK